MTLNSKNLVRINRLIIILIFHIILYNNCLSQEGSLDTNFGDSGISTVDFNSNFDVGRDVAIQSDGKILLTGTSNSNIALTRLNPDGTLDLSFGNLGKVITNLNYYDDALAIKIQDDGKILLAGYSSEYIPNTTTLIYSFILVRYFSNGLIDTSFGDNGIVIPNFGDSNQIFRALGIQQDGKIVASGDCYIGSNKEFVIMRFNSDGTLDNTFGNGGVFHTLIGINFNTNHSLAIQANGKIVLAGTTGISPKSIAIVRLNTNGTIDDTFGEEGKKIISISGVSDYCKSVNIQPDGKILLAGEIFISTGDFDFTLIRLNNDGTLDTTFANNGISIKNISGNDNCNSSIILSSGDIILSGTTSTNNIAKVAIIKFNETGILDTSFGDNGVTTINPNVENSDFYYGVSSASQLDGNIIIGGYARIQYEYDFMIIRIITSLELGVLSNNKEADLMFYPNPINEVGILKFELLSSQKISIYLRDITGKIIKTFINHKLIPSGKVQEFLYFTNINSGIYILSIKTKESITSIKVIK